MKHILFSETTDHAEVAILIKDTALNKANLLNNYIRPLKADPKYFIGFNLDYPAKGKGTVAQKYLHLDKLLPEIVKLKIKNLIVADAEYFKIMTKNSKAEPFYGHIVPCALVGYENLNIILIPNYQALAYNPAIQGKIDQSLYAIKTHIKGNYTDPGTNVIHFEHYPESAEDISIALDALRRCPRLTCDIEGLSLNFWECGISTISFAWNQHEGIAFAVDRNSMTHPFVVRHLLKKFLSTYEGTLTYHNSGFDLKILIYELWMENLGDYKGMLEGLHTVTKRFEDSMLIAYFAINNTVLNILGLKELAAEYIGNYAEDVTDTSIIPLPDLLTYNLKDCLATAYVFNKYAPIMLDKDQQDLYFDLFKPAIKTLLQTELCGIPISPAKVQEAKAKLTALVNKYTAIIMQSPEIQDFHYTQLQALIDKYTAKAKKKVYTMDDPVISRVKFNPGSDQQLAGFLYDYLGYPVYDLTDKKNPAVGAKTLKKVKANARTDEHRELLDAFIKLSQANKILTTFIPAFEKAQQLPNGEWRLYGNFRLGGTITLRLSSSKPNLMNLPSSSTFGKMIKRCFISTPNWVFLGSDFDALEDKVNTLQTRDPNKMKIYIDGFDGHCLRAYNYWPKLMPDIDPNSVPSINSIKGGKYDPLRSKSKAPTFALQYNGTFITLMNNCGFPEKEAKAIEANYHLMYAVADKWAADHIDRARTLGYVPLAFGGRLYTPLLAKSGKKLTYKAQSEARSAGNALTQSYCVLTLRAMNEFMERVWASPYKYDIFPAITIHDAIYLVVHNNATIVEWVNKHLVECMAWNELPELQHDIIKITSALDVFYQDWSQPIGIPNLATADDIKKIGRAGKAKYEGATP